MNPLSNVPSASYARTTTRQRAAPTATDVGTSIPPLLRSGRGKSEQQPSSPHPVAAIFLMIATGFHPGGGAGELPSPRVRNNRMGMDEDGIKRLQQGVIEVPNLIPETGLANMGLLKVMEINCTVC